MSYILEALRKAERERNPAQTELPRIESRTRFAQISDLQKLRPYRPVLVAGLCACLMIALTITLIHHPRASTPDATAVAPITAPAASTPTAHDPYATLLKQVYGDGNGPATLDDLVDTGNEAGADEMPAYNDADTGSHLSDAAAPAISDTPDDSANLAATPAPPPAPARPPPVTTVERVQLDPAPPPQVPRLSEMPVDYRAAFPAISLDVHSYDNTPKKRFIMITGKRYNEGDALQEGPRVVQIVPDGVVFDFRGEHVLFPIAH